MRIRKAISERWLQAERCELGQLVVRYWSEFWLTVGTGDWKVARTRRLESLRYMAAA
jgi:hypothetical protein